MIFRFVVARCRWLARVPLLPQLFDAMLLFGTTMAHPGKLRAIEKLERVASEQFGADAGIHRFGGTGFLVRGAELAHVHGNGLFDACVGRVRRDVLVDAGEALPHHVFRDSGWVSFWIRNERDLPCALELLRQAHAWQFQERHASPDGCKNE